MKRASQNTWVDGVAFVAALVVVSTGMVMRYALPPLEEIPRRIVAQQRFDVDVVSGATFTSRAIMAAAAAAAKAHEP